MGIYQGIAYLQGIALILGLELSNEMFLFSVSSISS